MRTPFLLKEMVLNERIKIPCYAMCWEKSCSTKLGLYIQLCIKHLRLGRWFIVGLGWQIDNYLIWSWLGTGLGFITITLQLKRQNQSLSLCLAHVYNRFINTKIIFYPIIFKNSQILHTYPLLIFHTFYRVHNYYPLTFHLFLWNHNFGNLKNT